MRIHVEKKGQIEGKDVFLYTLENDRGISLSCTNLGCTVTEIKTPDRDGNLANIVLGFERIEDYLKKEQPYFGSIIGRVAGRIGNSEFTLDGNVYKLPANEGKHHLHGGPEGFNKKVWQAESVEEKNRVGVRFTFTSEDGEEGYPGNLQVTVTYFLTNDNRWEFFCTATTDKKTLVNLTNHTYFNLTGNLQKDVLAHELKMKSSRFLELDDELIPTGKLVDVSDTPFDFRGGQKLITGKNSDHEQNKLVGNGYDHPFVLDEHFSREIELVDHESGRKLIVETDQPCVILYTGNTIPETLELKEGVMSRPYLGVCLETQGYSDAIHHPHFQQVILEPGDTYEAKTVYTFTVEE